MSEHREAADPFHLAPTWSGRGLALLRCLAFVILLCLFSGVAFLPGFWLLGSWEHVHATAELDWLLAVQVASQALGAVAATAVMARVGGWRLGDFGFGGQDRWRNFLVGAASGLALLSLMLLAMRLGSAVAMEPGAATLTAATRDAALFALLMLGVAFSEECFSRGYALVALSQSISFWPAALAAGAAFGLMHAVNDGETAMGLASAGLFGVVLAYSYRRTRSLWFAFGIHAGWDYAESFVFGVPNSGVTLDGSLFDARFDGPVWLTGGSAGPEGSLLMLLALAAMVLVIRQLPHAASGASDDAASAEALALTTAPR